MAKEAIKPAEEAKRARQGRSPAYPGIDLKEALEKARKLNETEGKYAVPMPSAFTAWGYGAKSSGGRETRAALGYFGLLTVEGNTESGKVKLTEKALRVLLDKREDETEKNALIREFALLPPIHKVLYEQFPDGIKSDATVEHFLVFEKGYNETAAAELVAEFKATATFAKLYEPAKVLDIKSGQSQESLSGTAKDPAKVGDLVQVEIDGALALEKPKRVRALQELDGVTWVFVDDHEAGAKMEHVTIIERGNPSSVAAQDNAPRLPLPPKVDDDENDKPGVRKSRFALKEGDVIMTFPDNLSADSVEDLDGYWQVFIKKARREAGD